ncbi:MAG: phytase [Bacteroidetes bacterium]|nr:phytase [Bacteroidota bacterium]
MRFKNALLPVSAGLLLYACQPGVETQSSETIIGIKPVVVTDQTPTDTDDPAIWVNPNDPGKSLIIGTDKGDENGGLFVFNLEGKLIDSLSVYPLLRPNNVDVEYGFKWDTSLIDIAVCTERITNKIRVFRLPDMEAIDNGGIPVFADQQQASPMGISLYKDSAGAIHAIVSRKEGPSDGYLQMLKLAYDSIGSVKAGASTYFGKFSGKKEIESLFVDDAKAELYYSDENFGVRKYDLKTLKEISVFGQGDFKEDNEGISLAKDSSAYLLISDQQANAFNVYSHSANKLIGKFGVEALESDGSESYIGYLNEQFPEGIFVAMSEGAVFHYYDWRDIKKTIAK